MQLLSSSSGGKQQGFAAWHPNFRNKFELPDTKTVRTQFFVNAAGALIFLSGLLFYAYNEYQLQDLNHQLAGWEQRIQKDTKPSNEAIALYKKFAAEEAKMKEYAAFVGGERLVFSDFVLTVGQTLPQNVTVNSIQYGKNDVRIGGTVKAVSEQATAIASGFEKTLRETPSVAKKFESIALSNVTRDASSGSFTFEVVLKFKK